MNTMRAVIIALALAALCLALDRALGAPGSATNRAQLGFEWDPNHPGEEVRAYTLYSQTNVVGTNWSQLATVQGGMTTNCWVPITNLPGWSGGYRGPWFFTVTASNLWGESGFSDVVSAPRIPTGDGKQLRIR